MPRKGTIQVVSDCSNYDVTWIDKAAIVKLVLPNGVSKGDRSLLCRYFTGSVVTGLLMQWLSGLTELYKQYHLVSTFQ